MLPLATRPPVSANFYSLFEARHEPGNGERIEPLILPPGGYSVLSRFAPLDRETQELSEDPRLFLFELQLGPGDTAVIGNGPARVEVQAESTPLITWMAIWPTCF